MFTRVFWLLAACIIALAIWIMFAAPAIWIFKAMVQPALKAAIR